MTSYLQRGLIQAGKAFDDVKLLRVWQSPPVKPESFVEAHRIDHQRVAFPFAGGVSEITRIEIRGMPPCHPCR